MASANFSDFAEFIEESNKAQRAIDNVKEYSDEYWTAHLEKVKWDRKIMGLMPDKNLSKEQKDVLVKQNCPAFNIWFGKL
jgi:hypothetical protein